MPDPVAPSAAAQKAAAHILGTAGLGLGSIRAPAGDFLPLHNLPDARHGGVASGSASPKQAPLTEESKDAARPGAALEQLLPELREWHVAGYVRYPWRAGRPGRRDPYGVWVAEVMAQQTRLAAMTPYYRKWMETFPTLGDVAAADLQDVLRIWAGLGYYRRAVHLHSAAQRIMTDHGGVFPSTREGLMSLPGIGRYTSGALLSLCFDQAAPAVDANVVRLFSRLWRLPLSQSRKRDVDDIETSILNLMHAQEGMPPGMLTEALMILGSRVCRPRSPLCGECPLAPGCVSFAAGWQPAVAGGAKKQTPVRKRLGLFLVTRAWGEKRVLMARNPSDGLLAGMWGFPTLPLDDEEDLDPEALARRILSEWNLQIESLEAGPLLIQDYSHFRRRQVTFSGDCRNPGDLEITSWPETRWTPLEEVLELPLSAIDRRMADCLLTVPRRADS